MNKDDGCPECYHPMTDGKEERYCTFCDYSEPRTEPWEDWSEFDEAFWGMRSGT